MPLRTKRWNDPVETDDGFRVLICRPERCHRPLLARILESSSPPTVAGARW